MIEKDFREKSKKGKKKFKFSRRDRMSIHCLSEITHDIGDLILPTVSKRIKGKMIVSILIFYRLFIFILKEEMDEQFMIKDDAVYYRSSSYLGPYNKIYRPNQGKVNSIIKCKFKGTNWNKLNVVILSGNQYLKCYSPTGSIIDIPLPCEIDRIWSIGTGMILQRSKSDFDSNIPKLFSLFHPLEEPRPLSIMDADDDNFINWITDESIQVIDIINELALPILVAWNTEV